MALVGEFEQTDQFGALSVSAAIGSASGQDAFVAVHDVHGEGVPTPMWARRMGSANGSEEAAGDVAMDWSSGAVLVSGTF